MEPEPDACQRELQNAQKLFSTMPSLLTSTAALTDCQKCNEKAHREMQTLRTGCIKVEPKIFAPPQTHRQDQLQYTVLLSLAYSVITVN